jgi:hypothetical protein
MNSITALMQRKSNALRAKTELAKGCISQTSACYNVYFYEI